MGWGWGVGSNGGRPLVENALTLDVVPFSRGGLNYGSGEVAWTGADGAGAASVSYELVHDGSPLLALSYRIGHEGRRVQQRIELTPTHPHFGGVRWWFRCPLSGDRCRMLYHGLSAGYDGFAGRVALGLAYRSQRLNWGDRADQKARKILAGLGGGVDELDLDLELIPKPKWMRWATYRRRLEMAREADQRSWSYAMARFGPELLLDMP